MRAFWRTQVEPWERWWLGAAMLATTGLVFAYVLGIDHALAGDEVDYHRDAMLWADGSWFQSLAGPFAEARPSAWKAPLYPIWLGGIYDFLGLEARGTVLLQGLLLAPLTVLLTWLLARRLLGPRVAALAAAIIAVFPLSWEYFGLLFPEALAIPATLAALLAFVGREPTTRVALVTGLLIGVNMLIRPSSGFIAIAVAVSFVVTAGWKRGAGLTALAALAAVLTIAPWTIRNAVELDGFVPLSLQDAAAFGTFNAEAAADDYAWRAQLEQPPEVVARAEAGEVGEPELRSELLSFTFDYIGEHPESVPATAFYNGVVRFWNLHSPSVAVVEADFSGRSRTVRAIGLAAYYLLAPLALIGLWRLRERRELLFPILAATLAIAFLFAVHGTTRYRATVEPVIAILAASTLVSFTNRRDGMFLAGGADANKAGARAPDPG